MPGIPGWVRARLSDRPDSEHEQAISRLAIWLVVGAYLFVPWAIGGGSGTAWRVLVPCGAFTVAALAVLCAILVRPGVSPRRRIVGVILDSAAISYFMIETGVDGLLLYVLYLWIIVGNGFRYGRFFLLSALVLSVLGFSAVIMLNDFWLAHVHVGISLLVGMVLISLYVLTLVQRLSAALDRVEKAFLSQRRSSATIAQEMRTPLSAVMGVADLLRDGQPGDPDTARMLDASSRELLRLVDALDPARASAPPEERA